VVICSHLHSGSGQKALNSALIALPFSNLLGSVFFFKSYRRNFSYCHVMNSPMIHQLMFIITSLAFLSGCTTTQPQIVDLTYSFDDQTVYWPKNQLFHRQDTARGMTPKGYWYASGTFSASEHGGTHLDAPVHFAKAGMSVDQIPVESLVGPAIVLDIRERCQLNPDYELTVQDIQHWEMQFGLIAPQDLVLVQTGWSQYWPDLPHYLGSESPDNPLSLHFPGISAEAMTFLVHDRQIRGVGIDTASIDPGQSRDFQAHQILSTANLYAIENVAYLDQVPPRGATVYALPIKIKDGTGGPVRLIAVIP
jgi:kynurenine formamidase